MEGALNLGNTVTVRRRHGMDGSIPENKARRELRHCLSAFWRAKLLLLNTSARRRTFLCQRFFFFSYCANSENEIGVPYILMSKATGDHLSTYDWPTHNLAYPNRVSPGAPGRPLKSNEKQKIMSQLGSYMQASYRN